MGNWGKKIYENDTALDVIDEIDLIFSEEDDSSKTLNCILSILKSKYSDTDDQSIAWLAAVYHLVPRSGKLVSDLYESIQKTSGTLPEETLQTLEEKILKCGRKPKRKQANSPKNAWKISEIYCYDIESTYADVPEFKGYTLGFLCIDHYKYAGVHPVVYVFRTKSSMEEIRANPDSVLNSEFWRTCKWDNNLFEYRAILWADKADKIPVNRLHACGRINVLPVLTDEFIVRDISCFPTIHFGLIENDLLRTRVLMHI